MLWSMFYGYNRIMPQEHESSEFTGLVAQGVQNEHGWKPGKEAVPLMLGNLPPRLLQ